ncbi:MAG: RHS repeat protein [Chloroflexi bacterium]|nr:RHS repeat protein [Chloroflexota bacterium]
MSIIIGYKDVLMVVTARKNVIKRTFIFNSPGTSHGPSVSKTLVITNQALTPYLLIAMEYADATGSGCSSCSGSGGASNQPSRIAYPTFAKEFVYDKRGRKAIEKDVLSETETYLADFDYDPAGNLIARTDKEGRETGYAFDDLNRLKTVTDPLNQVTEYFYDNRNNLTALTDANGNTTWFEKKKWGQGLICDLRAFTCFRKFSSCAIFFLMIVTLRLTAEWVKPNKFPI